MGEPSILIVDDDIVVRDSLGKWFESEGFRVSIAPGAAAALRAEATAESRVERG